MTIRTLLASAALLTLAGASVCAEEELADPFAMSEPAAQVAAPRPPAISASPPIKFLWRLLVPKTPKEEVHAPAVADAPAVAAPMVLVPPPAAAPDSDPLAVPETPAVVQAEKPKPKKVAKKIAVIPIPRPRPVFFPPVVAAETTAAEDPVDPEEITGSISTPQPTSATPPPQQPETAASPPPQPVEVAEVAQSDDFLAGDPAQLLGEEEGLVPELSEPEAIPSPKPATGMPEAGALPPPPKGEPYELIRTLQVLQDQIAQGSSEALATQRVLRREIDRSFAVAAAAVWQDERNAAAAVTYVLSGGPPMVLRALQTIDPRPAIDPHLIAGVLAYAEGNETEANQHLAEIDVARLAPSMGAQLALAKSALAVRNDPAAAKRFLAVARLLAPGTLVEEAALRREIFIADRLRDATAVEELARRYLARFRNSVYAGNFRNRFAAAVSRIDFGEEADFSRLEDLLLLVEPAARGQLCLTVALAAVVKGNSDAGAFAAERALALAPANSKEEARAQLYRAASMLADAEAFDTAVDAIERSNRNLLGSSDQSLHETVAATIAGIRAGTEAAAPPRQVAVLDGAKNDEVELTPLMTRARDALGATDELVKGMTK
jgi:chemotaxis protein MotC